MARIVLLLFFFLIFYPSALRSQTDSLSIGDSLVVPLSPLNPKPFAWTVQMYEKETFLNFPFRGAPNYLPLTPGVVFVNNEFHFRGSRSYEAGYFIDGVNVTNPAFGSEGVSLIPEAMEALEVHTGPYNASIGSYNGGIVMSRMRRGGDSLSVFASVQTDRLRTPGKQIFNTTVQGYENYVGTIGGPLPWFNMRFFLAGERSTRSNRQPMFLEPFRYANLVDDGLYSFVNKGKPLPGQVAFDRNWLPGNTSERSTLQGNASAEVFGVSLLAIGSYNEEEFLAGNGWPLALTNYFNRSRSMVTRTKTRFGALRAFYSFEGILDATVTYSFMDRFSKTFDQVFKDNWLTYSDSAANAPFFDTSQWSDRYNGPTPISTIYAFRFNAPGAPNSSYSKNRQSQSRWSIDLESHPAPSVAMKAGGSIDSWTIRSFKVSSISYISRVMNTVSFVNEYEKRARGYYYISNYGYTFLGQQTDGVKIPGGPNVEVDAPYTPRFASAYVEGMINTEDLLLQGGVRYEWFDSQFKSFSGSLETISPSDFPYNSQYDIIDESRIQPSAPTSVLLPRLNIRLKASERTSFRAGYGQFAQMPSLDALYVSSSNFSRSISPARRSPYGGQVASNVRPETSKQFEFGVEHSLNDHVVLKAAVYYKTLSNQLEMARAYDSRGNPMFTQYVNNGKGLAKGFETEFRLRDNGAFSVLATYAYSIARGLSSFPLSNQVVFSDQTFPSTPLTLRPYDYQQSHRASLIVSARTGTHGPLLDGIEATLVLTARSGHPYTRQRELTTIGGSGPWTIGVFSLQDPRFVNPLEARNSSTTPATMNLDLHLSKTFGVDVAAVTVFVQIINILNTKNVLNVYPTTGAQNDDSWLGSAYAEFFRVFPNYDSFYRDINLKNRFGYMTATGNDIYGPPRSIQLGVNVGI